MACTLSNCDVATSLYGYRPSLIANILFLGVLSICLIGCIATAAVTRRYLGFSLLLAIAYIFEIVAYSERIIAWNDPWLVPGFIRQVLFLTVGPIFATMA